MKGANAIKPSPGRTKHKARPRPKYVSQWARTERNKRGRMERQRRRCRRPFCRCQVR